MLFWVLTLIVDYNRLYCWCNFLALRNIWPLCRWIEGGSGLRVVTCIFRSTLSKYHSFREKIKPQLQSNGILDWTPWTARSPHNISSPSNSCPNGSEWPSASGEYLNEADELLVDAQLACTGIECCLRVAQEKWLFLIMFGFWSDLVLYRQEEVFVSEKKGSGLLELIFFPC